MKEYRIVEMSTTSGLECMVAMLLDDGFVPLGGVAILWRGAGNPWGYAQAMLREKTA